MNSFAIPLVVAALAIGTWALYQRMLPKPIPGIPYNKETANSVLGDIPSIFREANRTKDVLFLSPFGPPTVLLADFRESQDILLRRKEFDRASDIIRFFRGMIPDHQIAHKTDAVFKAHRKLLQDLMAPTFLRSVAAPDIWSSAIHFIDLWNEKAYIADGRPFNPELDIYYTSLDAVMGFSFGSRYPHRAIHPQLDYVSSLSTTDIQSIRVVADKGSKGGAVEFDRAPLHCTSQATLDLTAAFEDIVGKPMEDFIWWWKKREPAFKRALRLRDEYLKEQVLLAVARMEAEDEKKEDGRDDWVKCAVDLIVHRERRFAGKEGREPVYWSNGMRDEIFGFVIAGHDTTSTTLLWAVKYLASNVDTQTTLRNALEAAHTSALAERRSPSANEIAHTSIPYLDAIIEEVLRLATTVSVILRECDEDAVVLGHHIPKGTNVMMLTQGPSFHEPGFAIDDANRSPSSRAAAKERGVREWDLEGMREFRPERWLVPRGENGEVEFDATAGPFLAFGLGLRGCYGRRLAYLQLRILLTLIVWNFELLPCPEELSGYAAIEGLTRKPDQVYVRLQKIR